MAGIWRVKDYADNINVYGIYTYCGTCSTYYCYGYYYCVYFFTTISLIRDFSPPNTLS